MILSFSSTLLIFRINEDMESCAARLSIPQRMNLLLNFVMGSL